MQSTNDLLLDDLTHPDEGTLERFLLHWHGPPLPPAGPFAEENPAHPMPLPLQVFYRLAAQWPRLIAQNHLLAPSSLVPENRRLVFYLENQGVSLWSTLPVGEDPPVWMRRNEPGALWQLEGEPLSRFLLQVALFESLLAAPEGAAAACLHRDHAYRALQPLRLLPLAPWLWPTYPTRFYAGDGLLAMAGPNPPDSSTHIDLTIGARRGEPLRFLDPIVDESWDYYSPRDGRWEP